MKFIADCFLTFGACIKVDFCFKNMRYIFLDLMFIGVERMTVLKIDRVSCLEQTLKSFGWKWNEYGQKYWSILLLPYNQCLDNNCSFCWLDLRMCWTWVNFRHDQQQKTKAQFLNLSWLKLLGKKPVPNCKT